MIKFENTEVWGFEHALRGMRQPMQSHNKSDSRQCKERDCSYCEEVKNPIRTRDMSAGKHCYIIGRNDMSLAQKLIKGGSEHRKFLRQIFVSVDITAPMYWWKEFDTYKVGTTANSTSTMHKIHAKEFTLKDFSCEHICIRQSMDIIKDTIDTLNVFRDIYLNGGILKHKNGNQCCYDKKDKEIWWQMIQLLPSSYNQTRTITMTYENLLNMYRQRKNHKLDEWRVGFMEWVESLPYAKELIMYTGEEE